MDFTDKLIEEHLNQKERPTGDFLPRDPASFRKAIESDFKIQSPYNQFFIIEALKKGDVKGIWDELMHLKHQPDSVERSEEL
jgi:hypothetical protein